MLDKIRALIPARTNLNHRRSADTIRTLTLLMVFAASTGLAQLPPTSTTNLKVLPADIRIDSLSETMAGFTRALGVRCTYCHEGRDGQPPDSINFASVALVDVAKSVRASDTAADALKLYQFNVEMVPTSTFALRSLAEASLAAGDTAAAIASFERALTINANDSQSSAALSRLRRPDKVTDRRTRLRRRRR